MPKLRYFLPTLLVLHQTFFAKTQPGDTRPDEMYRPQFHFTPKEKWMNDPNGMVYYKGVYHLFFQYNPNSSVWGPMHWGYATSTDLIHWNRQSIKLFPDSLGTIFSGSAVVDEQNTSGFGKSGQTPLVAIFTHQNENGEKAGRNDFQNQSLAYSLDNGETWIKYSGNPVLRNPGIKDFRDPKVMWYEPAKKWIMSLAVVDRIFFYSSTDLKQWIKESEFGSDAGEHGGVWECPDLVSLKYKGKLVWVLIVSVNPGGPNKGSAIQYFLGDFNGKNFSAFSKETRWLDYGPDDYAGVTWSNIGNRKIFLGWMSNWMYAKIVPTETWRSAMTIPRELRLVKPGDQFQLTSKPVKEINKIRSKRVVFKNATIIQPFDIMAKTTDVPLPCMISLSMNMINDFSIAISNDAGDSLLIGYDKLANKYFIDRTKSGKTNFHPEFGVRHTAPRVSSDNKMKLTLLVDVSSVELFADDGMTVMTEIFFPNRPFNKISINSNDKSKIKKLEYYKLKSIWK